MEEDLKQKRPMDLFNSQIMKENPNSMVCFMQPKTMLLADVNIFHNKNVK